MTFGYKYGEIDIEHHSALGPLADHISLHFTSPFYLTMLLNRLQHCLLLCDFANLVRQIGEDEAAIAAAKKDPLRDLQGGRNVIGSVLGF